MSWLEKKVATALFGAPPTSTVEEALQNFLKVGPTQGFSLSVYQQLYATVVNKSAEEIVFCSCKSRDLLNATKLYNKMFFFFYILKIVWR